ncbi:hypothetical protein AB0E08_08005 [Streptomyces sp. NPDC048281]|uniref:hypothetical protein n=1 Tax=Streptomyces sp. NPDC048281 TaxID=3154715 RepID=UPI003429247E
MPLNLEPIIVEPEDLTSRVSDPERGRYVLYDTDFPVETDPKYAVAPGVPPLAVPHFSVGEVACFAFAGHLTWLKRQLKGKPYKVASGQTKAWPLLLNGKDLTFRSVARGGITAPKRYTLADIERLACALYERGDIDGYELQRVDQILIAMARQFWARNEKREG